jgi:hypothetical protein
MRTVRRLQASLVAVATAAMITGCALHGGHPFHGATPRGGGQGDCPALAASAGFAEVDYVDFLQANATQYIADLGRPGPSRRPHLGAEQLTVRCSFSRLNAQTHRAPPPPRDGDAAFVPAGTPVYSVRGWSPLCRLAARHDGEWHTYLAYQDDSRRATPKPCAVQR